MSNQVNLKIGNLRDFLKEQYSGEVVEKIVNLEKIRMKRTRAVNKKVLNMAVDVYNETHNDSELRVTDYGIVQVRKCSITN